jgi:hypothetical protein
MCTGCGQASQFADFSGFSTVAQFLGNGFYLYAHHPHPGGKVMCMGCGYMCQPADY